MRRAAKIVGVGRALPERSVSNRDLEKIVDTSDQWIVERTGIRNRRILDDELFTSDLAASASREACRAASIAPSDLDAIVVATITPDMPMPATAVFVQQKIGAGPCPAFDISAACAGFIYALSIGDAMVARGTHTCVLVVGVEILSRVLDWSDRSTCVLFGDGAGAAILQPAEEGEPSGILDIEICTDGAQAPHLAIPGGGTREPASHRSVESKRHAVHMNGRQVFTHAVKNMASASRVLLERNDMSVDDVDIVFAHQANMRILESVGQRVGIGMDRFFNNIDKYGNTSSASIPIGMSEAVEKGRVKRGDVVLLTALGAGLSWGSALLRW